MALHQEQRFVIVMRFQSDPSVTYWYSRCTRGTSRQSRSESKRAPKTTGYRVYSHDVTVAILVSQNNETAAMLVSQTNPLGVELFSYANAFFCSNIFA